MKVIHTRLRTPGLRYQDLEPHRLYQTAAGTPCYVPLVGDSLKRLIGSRNDEFYPLVLLGPITPMVVAEGTRQNYAPFVELPAGAQVTLIQPAAD